MRYRKTLKVEKHISREMEKIVQEATPDVKKDGVEFDEEVVFSNGLRMAIQVCGPGDPAEESCWTQGVLFSPAGTELGCTDVGESFLGEYHIWNNEDEYIVDVVSR